MSDQLEEVLQPGSAFGRYSIVRRIGSGGMGAVYEAIHRDLKKRVAIKILLPSVAHIPEVRVRFVREGESAARIRHPHVVDVSDVGTENGIPFLVMEYLEGQDLARMIQVQGVLPESRVAEIMLPVCSALMAAHEEGIVHRDMKPENIFLAKQRHGEVVPKVLDFGISKLSSPGDLRLTGTAAILGTPYYMSPEQAKGERSLDARTDQYSVGVILYECATGVTPFNGDAVYALLHAIVEGDYRPPREVAPAVSPAFEAVIVRAMARDPTQRFGSILELGRHLLPFATPEVRSRWTGTFALPAGASADVASVPSVLAPSPPRPLSATTLGSSAVSVESKGTRPRASRSALIAGAAAVVVALGIAGAVAHWRTNPPAPIAPAALPPSPTRVATFQVDVRAEPPTAVITLDGVAMGAGALHRPIAVDGTVHTMSVSAAGFVPTALTFRDQPPPDHVALAPLPTMPRSGPVAETVPPVVPSVRPAAGVSSRPVGRNGGGPVVHPTRSGTAAQRPGPAINGAPIIE